MNKFKRFLFHGLLMTCVSLLMRTVSVSFHVYLSNTIGAVAMGLFSLITTVYGFSITLATSGIQLACTRLISEAYAKEDVPNGSLIRCMIQKCIGYALFFSISTALVLFFFAPLIGERLLGDPRTVSSLKLLSISLPAIALSSVFSGYFIAVRCVHKNALVSVTEQGVKIGLCILLLTRAFAKDVESACLAVVAGGVVADLVSCFLQFCFYTADRKKASAALRSSEKRGIQRELLHIALPVAFSAYVRSGLITLEHLLIPRGLEKSGNSRDVSLAAYGTVQSMVFPLLLFPSALSASFAGLLIPEMAEAKALGHTERIASIATRVFRAVLLFAIGVSGIFLCFSHEIGTVFYPGTSAENYLLLLAPLIPIMYLDTAVDAMLKGLGEQVYTMGVNIADSLMSVILVWLLIPKLGINGYLITVYFTEVVNATLSITRLLNVTGIKPRIFSWVGKPVLAVILATTVIRFFLSRALLPQSGRTALFLHILLSSLLYLLFITIMGATRRKRRLRPSKIIGL